MDQNQKRPPTMVELLAAKTGESPAIIKMFVSRMAAKLKVEEDLLAARLLRAVMDLIDLRAERKGGAQ